MTDADPYDVLGVQADATHQEIRSAYRRLAVTHHPDHDTDHGPSDRMMQINHAWSVLGDPVRRAEHDRTLGGRATFIASPASATRSIVTAHTLRHIRGLLVTAILGLSVIIALFVLIAMSQSGAR